MSPHGIIGPQNQSSPNSGKKCTLARPLSMHNFVAIRQEVSEIYAIKNSCSRKSGPKFTKTLKTCYPLKIPIMPNFIKIGETMHLGEKRYKFFYILQYFGSPGEPPGPRSLVWVWWWGTPTPYSYLQNFVPFRRPLSEISAAKHWRFCCLRDPQKKQKKISSKRCLPCGNKKSTLFQC